MWLNVITWRRHTIYFIIFWLNNWVMRWVTSVMNLFYVYAPLHAGYTSEVLFRFAVETNLAPLCWLPGNLILRQQFKLRKVIAMPWFMIQRSVPHTFLDTFPENFFITYLYSFISWKFITNGDFYWRFTDLKTGKFSFKHDAFILRMALIMYPVIDWVV